MNREQTIPTAETPAAEDSGSTLYLVTGAAGFLGGTVCRRLVALGRRVRAFVLPGDKAGQYLPAGAEICEGDLTDLSSLHRFFEAAPGTKLNVIHCASIVTVDPGYSRKVMDVNVGGTKNLIDCCLEAPGFSKLVYVSSTGAIPELPKGRPITEVDHFDPERDPEHVRGCYSQSKALATQAVLDAVHGRGLNACVVHPSGIMGPEDYAVGETTRTMIQIINGQMPLGIDGTFNLCDVRDLAAGCIAAVERGRRGECYILGNQAVRFKDFARLVAEESGCRAPGLFLPCSLAGAVAGIAERQAKKSGKKPLLTTFSIYNLARNNDFDSSKARRELGYRTRSYRETLHDEIAWLRQTGKIAAGA